MMFRFARGLIKANGAQRLLKVRWSMRLSARSPKGATAPPEGGSEALKADGTQ